MPLGPCDACTDTNNPDIHTLVFTTCGRALCRGCDCGGNCYDRHLPSCPPCIEPNNREVAKQMKAQAALSMNLLDPTRE